MGTSANLYAIHQTFSNMKTVQRGSVVMKNIIFTDFIDNILNKNNYQVYDNSIDNQLNSISYQTTHI
jgi:hypothetical protein